MTSEKGHMRQWRMVCVAYSEPAKQMPFQRIRDPSPVRPSPEPLVEHEYRLHVTVVSRDTNSRPE